MYVVYDTDYAIYVHEDLNARHKKGKNAKFLERPARDETVRRDILGIMKKTVRFKRF